MTTPKPLFTTACTHFISTIALIAFLLIAGTVERVMAQQFEILPNFWQTNGEVRAIETDKVNDIVYIGGDFTKIGPNNANAALLSSIDATVLKNFQIPNGPVNIAVEDGLGGWYIGGDFSAVGGEARRNLAQIDSNGVLTQWTPITNGSVYSMLLHLGKLYVGGAFTSINETIRGGLAALDPATGELHPFDPALNGAVHTMEVTNNTLYIGGSFTRVDAKHYGNVAIQEAPQYLFVDKRDISDENPREILASVPDGNGGYFIGGDFDRVNGVPRARIAHIDSLGTLTPWNPGADGNVRALKLDNGVLYAGGEFDLIGDLRRASVAALDAATAEVLPWSPKASGPVNTIDVTGDAVYVGGSFSMVGKFVPIAGIFHESDAEIVSIDGVIPDGAVLVSVPDGNGGWYVGGDFTTYSGLNRSRLAQIDSTGQVTDWNPGADGTVRAIAVSGNTVYVGGEFTQAGGEVRIRLAAINAITGTANFWNPNANNSVYSLAVAGNTVFIGGDFTNVAGASRSRLAAVRSDNGALIPWNTSANGRVNALVVHDNVVYAGGAFTTAAGSNRSRIVAINASSGEVLPWNPGANGDIETLAIGNNAIFVGGHFTSIAGTSRNRLAVLDINTSAVLGWNPNMDNFVRTLLVRDEVVYAGGDFGSVGGNSSFKRLVALGSNGAVIPGATPSASSTVQTLAYSEGKIFTGSSSGFIGGDSRQNAAAFDKITGAIRPWSPNPVGEVLDMKIAENTIFLGGTFSSLNLSSGSVSRFKIAEVDLITAIPTTFAPSVFTPGIQNAIVNALLVTPSTLYAGGSFTTVNGFTRNGLAAVDRAGGATTSWNPSMNMSAEIFVMEFYENDIIVGGKFFSAGGQGRTNVAKVSLQSGNGTPWDPNQQWSSVKSLSVQNSVIFIGSDANLVVGENTRNRAAAFDLGSGDLLDWNPNANNVVYALKVHENSVFLGGSFTNVGGSTRNRIAEVDNENGSVSAFAPSISPSGTNRVSSMALSDDGTALYIGGQFSTVSPFGFGITRNNLAAFDLEFGNLLPWNPNANNKVNSVFFKPADDNNGAQILVCGEFTSIGSQIRNGAATINVNGNLTSWQPEFLSTNNNLSFISIGSGKVFIGGLFEGVGAIEKNRIAALDLSSGSPLSFPVSFNNPVNSLQIADSILYFGGEFNNVNGNARNRLAATNRFTGELLDWNPGASGPVTVIKHKDDLVYVGGFFSSAGGAQRNRVACLSAATGFATIWNPNANGAVHSLAVEENVVYLGGAFTTIAGTTRNRIARVNRETGLLNPWNPNANSTVFAIAVSNSSVYLGGSFSQIGVKAQPYIVAVSPLTGVALSFNTTLDNEVRNIKLLDNKIFVAGAMSNVNGNPQRAFVVMDKASEELYPSNLDFANSEPTSVRAMSVAGSKVFLGGNFSKAGNSGSNLAVASFDFSECNLVLDCPSVQIPLPITGEIFLDPNLVANQLTDCNDGLIKSFSPSSLDCSNLGDNAITAIVSNQTGDTATCVFLARLVDTTPPMITTPDTLVLATLPGSCEALVEGLDTPVASDNCSEVTLTNNAPPNLPKGNNTITWTATDAEGLTSTALQVVTVIDNEPPSLQVPADLSINSVASACGAPLPSLGTATATDNCDVPVVTNNAPSAFPVGTNFVTWTATDESGNSITAQQAITVVDNRLPTITAPEHLQLAALTGVCEVDNVELGLPITADNCGVASVSNNAPLSFPIGTTSVIWTVEDLSGNTASAIQTVTVSTDEVPEITCPENATRDADDAACSYSVQEGEFIPSIAANCPIISLTNDFNNLENLNGASLPPGTTAVTYTVVGAGENTADCTVNITVLDVVPPTIECPSPINTNTLPGQCGAEVEFNIPPTSDNCGLQSMEQIAGPASGAFFQKGSTDVLFEAIDTQGNSSTCTLEVHVLDLEPPVITNCQLSITINSNPGQCGAIFQYFAPSGTDNCPGASIAQVAGLGSGALYPIGTTTESYLLSDASGNTATCSFTVTVVDVEAPEALCNNLTVELDANNAATVTGEQLGGNSSDNCGIASIQLSKETFGIADVGVNFVTVTATDAAGLSSTCTATVTVLPGASQCNVDGGTLATSDPRTSLCVGDNKPNLIQLSVSGNVGTGRFGLVRQGDLEIMATNASGLFDMENYPAGNYFVGHVAVPALSALSGVTNVSQLSGCFDLSNQLLVNTLAVNGGTIATSDPTSLCNQSGLGSTIEFEVTGQQGSSFRWALLNQGGTSIINSNSTGTFNFDQIVPGTYRVAHAAALGVSLSSANPANLPACVAVSNTINVSVEACEPSASLSTSPNPTNAVSNVEFSIPQEGRVFLELVDMSGRTLRTVHNGVANAGATYRYTVHTSGLANGIYIYRLTTGSEVIIEKMMIAR